MPDVTRTFVALDVPRALMPRFTRLQDELAADVPGVRWSGAGQAHLTLVFLGDVPHADLAAVCRAVEEATAGTPRFELSLQGVGVFPDVQRPRVIWTGVAGSGLETLVALQAAVASAAAKSGYPGDSRPYRPHVTLGRFDAGPRGRKPGRKVEPARPEDLSKLLLRRAKWSAGPFVVQEVITYSSTLTPEGSVYAPLARARLKSSP
ncbi:MAG: RNA 2',3'-cyclic phosphodiesterase [Isosphaeraceae bacterium]